GAEANREAGMPNKLGIVVCCLVGMFPIGLPQAAPKHVVLITPDEAQRPLPADSDLAFRAGVSRGPAIELVSPTPSGKTAQSPLHLRLKFAGRRGAQIDVDSLKLTYIRNAAPNLTDRVKELQTPAGVDVPEAEIPAGMHIIRADVKDKDGRSGFRISDLTL